MDRAERSREGEDGSSSGGVYCVTGANGYIGSWLVKLLLQRGHKVHATFRDPGKALHLLSSWTHSHYQLRLFKADLLEEGSFDKAVEGCDGVFHVAASMEFNIALEESDIGKLWFKGGVLYSLDRAQQNLQSLLPILCLNLEDNYVQSNTIEPAINGTVNLLKSCVKSKSVRRVVFTSSISTLTAKDGNGNWRRVVDETCLNPTENILKAKASGWVYALSKCLTEESAFKFAKEEGMDLVSVITTTVAGPFLTPNVPSSVQVFMSPMTGDAKFSSILSAVNSRMGSIALVHIEDICSAHIFLMEHNEAEGRYICCVDSCTMDDLVYFLSKSYPCSNLNRFEYEAQGMKPCEISSKKLTELGFVYKHDMNTIIFETISYCVDNEYLPPLIE